MNATNPRIPESDLSGPMAAYHRLRAPFSDTHQTTLNVALHLVTTPLGIVGALALTALVSPVLPAVIALVYAVGLLGRVPLRLWIATSLALVPIVAAASLPWLWWQALVALVVGYVGQDVAHWLCGEDTLQSRYLGETTWLGELTVHTALLLPLVLDAAVQPDRAPWRVAVPPDRIVWGPLDPSRADDLATVRAWVTEAQPTTDHTTHWWPRDTPPHVHEAIQRIAHGDDMRAHFGAVFGRLWEVAPVLDMNEVYVAGPDGKRNSDRVFFMSHIDGPWALWPWASVYRCLVGVNDNAHVHTHFPTAGTSYDDPRTYTITTGDVLGFDFNRELHYITEDPGRAEDHRRITLKLHYMVYPRFPPTWGWMLGWATARYNERARQLFLDTIATETPGERFWASLVLYTTKGFELVQRGMGTRNVLYVLALALWSLLVRDPLPLVVGAGYVHYALYMAVFHVRGPISFGTFVRDALFFKTVSMTTLAAMYLSVFAFDPVSLALLVAGFGTTMAATSALGLPRTYFGAELGLLPPERVTAFPYGWLPHPMILGGIVGLLGIHALAPFREAWPWVIPLHVACYVVHLLQEALDTRGFPASEAD
jgi:hypothetical protein